MRPTGRSERNGQSWVDRKYAPEYRQTIWGYCLHLPGIQLEVPLLARELVDIHKQYIWRFPACPEDRLVGSKVLVPERGPNFVPKAADIVDFT